MLSIKPFGRLGTPMTKSLKSISGTPSSAGTSGTIPGAPIAPALVVKVGRPALFTPFAGRMNGSRFAEIGLKTVGDSDALGSTHWVLLVHPGKKYRSPGVTVYPS